MDVSREKLEDDDEDTNASSIGSGGGVNVGGCEEDVITGVHDAIDDDTVVDDVVAVTVTAVESETRDMDLFLIHEVDVPPPPVSPEDALLFDDKPGDADRLAAGDTGGEGDDGVTDELEE